MTEAPVLSFKRASLGYRDRAVLTGVDFELPYGAFLGILGPNGAGKSTILKTILGLIAPLKGRFEKSGAHGVPRFGYVPQKEKLDPIYPLTAYAVASMGTYSRFEFLNRFQKDKMTEMVKRCLRDCGALELSEKRFSDLSGGQKQRVLIARALSAAPDLLILDEPLAGIDVTTQKALLALMTKLKERRHLTVLMVSHRLQAEKDLFTHIAWVDEGKAEMGPAGQMLAKRNITQIFGEELRNG